MKYRFGLIVPVVAAAALTFGSTAAWAQTTATSSESCDDLQFQLANPAPGSMLLPGGYLLEGVAADTRATTGSGIDRVDFFLGNRDEGGVSLGSVAPSGASGALGPGSFAVEVELPDMIGGHDLFAYAYSTVTGQEAVIAVPISVGEDPEAAGVMAEDMAAPAVFVSCTPAPTGSTTTPTSTPTTSTTAPTSTAPESSEETVSLSIANPVEGATLLPGAYSIDGQATGVDRVEVFLDNRDEGGLFLGNAVPGDDSDDSGMFHIVVDLPENQTGVHSLWFYAQSSTTGEWTAVEIPVTIE
jgi:hypothetical protein